MQNYLLIALYSYLIGSVHVSWIVIKIRKKKDIRNEGTRNSGASNAFIQFGYKYGILTAVTDVLKGTFAVCATRFFFGANTGYLALSLLLVIMGHVFPVWMGFKGGKGLATLIGATLGVNFFYALAIVIALVAVTLLTNYIPIGTAASCVCGTAIFLVKFGLVLATLFYALAAVLMISKHIPNYIRIARKEEIPFRAAFTDKEGKKK
jgi:glycerol-3-phosphate acyltransferase PlsY